MPETNTEEITYREYLEGDEQDILHLFNRVFSKNLSLTRWNWENKYNPNGSTYFHLALTGTKLIGQSAAVPLVFNHEGRTLNAVRVQNVMVHSDFRNKGVFLNTLRQLTYCLYDEKLDFIITFPNDKSIGAFIRKLDYSHIFDVFIYTLKVEFLGRDKDANVEYEFDEGVHVGEEDIEFIRSMLNGFDIFNKRSLKYMNWRYHQDSTREYVLVRVFKDQQQVGLVVYKPYVEGMSIDLVEFFVRNDKDMIASTLNSICDMCTNSTVRSINVWSMDHYPWHQSLLDLGFKKTDLLTHVVCKLLSSKASKNSKRITSYYLSMGDSDVY
jgi:hypothetical protein